MGLIKSYISGRIFKIDMNIIYKYFIKVIKLFETETKINYSELNNYLYKIYLFSAYCRNSNST